MFVIIDSGAKANTFKEFLKDVWGWVILMVGVLSQFTQNLRGQTMKIRSLWPGCGILWLWKSAITKCFILLCKRCGIECNLLFEEGFCCMLVGIFIEHKLLNSNLGIMGCLSATSSSMRCSVESLSGWFSSLNCQPLRVGSPSSWYLLVPSSYWSIKESLMDYGSS